MASAHPSDFGGEPALTHDPDGPRWPGVLGTIFIIFGVGGVLGGACGVAGILFGSQLTEAFASRMPPEALAKMQAQQAVQDQSRGVNAVLTVLAMFVAGMLLVGGIRLLRRRASSTGLLRVWACIKIVMSLLSTAVAWMTLRAVTQETLGSQPDATQAAIMNTFGAVALAGGLLWAWALPVFVLVWFSRGTIRDQVARWE